MAEGRHTALIACVGQTPERTDMRVSANVCVASEDALDQPGGPKRNVPVGGWMLVELSEQLRSLPHWSKIAR